VEILNQLGDLFLAAVPTVILVFLFYVFLRWSFFAPIERVLSERHKRAAGARQEAEASRVAVHKSIYHEFVTRFVGRVKALRVGNGLDSGVDMGPCINEQQLQTVMSYVEIGKNEGAKLLTGGNRLDGGIHAKGWFHTPTVFGDCSPQMRIAQEEIFGPVLAVIKAKDFAEAMTLAEGCPIFHYDGICEVREVAAP